eukprot:m.70549 g.70549  ORF g.70549 m.70549 type:complete len:90 (-) comp18523_c0_seq1:432-701(-)
MAGLETPTRPSSVTPSLRLRTIAGFSCMCMPLSCVRALADATNLNQGILSGCRDGQSGQPRARDLTVDLTVRLSHSLTVPDVTRRTVQD